MPKYRILVVDDEADVRSILCTTLRPHYEIVEAHDGLDALEKLDRVEPDFVLMDVMMPLMDGYQACEAIRKDPRFHDLPVMFLSALGTKEDIRKGYSSGANLYLTKPFEPARLLRNIEVFFETTPPPYRPKRFTLERLQQLERGQKPPQGSIHDLETVHDLTPPPPDVKAPPPAPAAEPEESTPIIEVARPQAQWGLAPRILIVDDDKEIVNLMTMMVGDDFEVVFAHDGLQAIERVVRFQPDLMVVDIMLPKMSGFQLCQSLRANKTFAQIPILVCSAKCGERDVAYARRVGANDFLKKPFKGTELLGKLSGLTGATGFTVRDKAIPIQNALNEIMPKVVSEDAFEADSEVRRAEGVPGAEADTSKAVKNFLKKEGSKGAFGREEEAPAGKKDKKKRRFRFGFKKTDTK